MDKTIRLLRERILKSRQIYKPKGKHKFKPRQHQIPPPKSGYNTHMWLVELHTGTDLRELLLSTNDAQLCELLGIHRATLYRWRKKLGISKYSKGQTYVVETYDTVMKWDRNVH